MTTTTRYTDFTVTENKEGWLVECYDSEQEEPKDFQVSYWAGRRWVCKRLDIRKAEAMAWIDDIDNIGELNDLLAELVNTTY